MSFSASIAELIARSNSPLVAAADTWQRVPLGDIASILNGFPWKSSHFNETGGAPIVRIRDVTSGCTETRYDGPIDDGYWIENGDLLVGMDGDFNARIWGGGRGLLNQRVCRIMPDERFYLKEFLARLLPGYLNLINDETHSITVKHLSSKTLAELPLPLPPLPEQRRIAAKIDSLSAKSARARENLDRFPRLVEKYKQAVLAAAFRGDLTPDWRAAHGLPADYRAALLEDVLTDIRYGTAKKCDYGAGSTPVLRIPNVQRGEITLDDLKFSDFEETELQKLRLQSGDLLLIRSNGSLGLVGRSAIVSDTAAGMLFAGYLIRLRFDPQTVLPKYVQLWLQSSSMRSIIEGLAKSTSGVNNINSTQLEQLPIQLTNLDEQGEIVRRIETAFAWIARLAKEATSARALIDHLDQAILAKAFRGELVPQDLNDEPATALLERIRAERAKSAAPGRRRSA
jgi:type I restriction enzyme, S subunit